MTENPVKTTPSVSSEQGNGNDLTLGKTGDVESPAPLTTQPTITLTASAREYLIAEHETLQGEKHDIEKIIDSDRMFSIIATGAFWSWFAVNKLSPDLHGLYFLPIGLILLFLLKRRLNSTAIDAIGEYTNKIERSMELPEGFGWESHLKKVRREWFRVYDFWYWLFLLGLNGFLAWSFWQK